MTVWNPWRGCKKISDGCKYCYIHEGDSKRGINTNAIVKTKAFYQPLIKKQNGEYQMNPTLVYLAFSSDFLIAEADQWRQECWQMIKERSDCYFLFLTKRIMRFMDCIPDDWGSGYDNVIVGCTIENQANANLKLAYFKTLPIKHKVIIVQPMLTKIELSEYLDGIDLVVAGGEAGVYARPLDYAWILKLKDQCVNKQVNFEFRQCGSYFIKDERKYHLKPSDLSKQARLAKIDYEAFSNPWLDLYWHKFKDNDCELLENISKIHTTPMGVKRIKANLKLQDDDVVGYCVSKIMKSDAIRLKKGKNWYIESDGVRICINASSYTIITAHMMK